MQFFNSKLDMLCFSEYDFKNPTTYQVTEKLFWTASLCHKNTQLIFKIHMMIMQKKSDLL